MSVPSLGAGFILDDWVQRSVVKGALSHTSKWSLFNFGGGDPERLTRSIAQGPLPWFTLPELKLRFLRPLSSALIVLDTTLFGDVAWPQHLHSSLWYLALTAVALALYRRVTPGVAVLAGVLFALDDAHVIPVMWLANRNALVAVTFAWLGLLAHLRWREQGWRPGAWLSAALFALGLSAGETGVGAMAYVLAYELVGRTEPWRLRLRGLAPSLVVLAGYVVVYKATGAGARGSASYLDPVTEPLVFLAEAPGRFFANLGIAAFGLPDLWLSLPSLRIALMGGGVLGLVVAWLALRRWAPVEPEARRTLHWLALGAVGALLPALATFPVSRLLTASSLGFAPVAASLLVGAWRDGGLRRVAGVAWLGVAFVLQPLTAWVLLPHVFTGLSTRTVAAVKNLELRPEEHLVLLSCTDFAPAVYGLPVLLDEGLPAPRSWQVWSMAPHAVTVHRTGPQQLELEVVGGRMVESVFEENFRGASFPFVEGQRVGVDGATLTVLAVERGKPVRLRADLERPVEAFTFAWWDGERLVRLSLPAVGEALQLPRSPTIFEALLGLPAPRS